MKKQRGFDNDRGTSRPAYLCEHAIDFVNLACLDHLEGQTY
jgi:hypothetical protein